VVDRILREQVNFEGQGFRLGPFELLDLTGLDVSHTVMESIYHQYYQEPRFRPSVITAQRKSAGLFGRKASAGFYTYVDGRKIELAWPNLEPSSEVGIQLPPFNRSVQAAPESASGCMPELTPESAPESQPDREAGSAPGMDPFAATAEEPGLSGLRVWIAPLPPGHPDSVLAELLHYLAEAGVSVSAAGGLEPRHAATPAADAAPPSIGGSPPSDALILMCPLGEDASAMAARLGLDATRAIALDALFAFGWKRCKLRSLMATVATTVRMQQAACRLFSLDGASVALLSDSPGFVTQRILAMIVAIACDMAQQAVGSPQDIDDAVRIGLGYPTGPLSMGDALGPARIHAVLKAMHACTGDPRYRPSVWLRRRADLHLALRVAT
jgi:3-hydroxyacyl-CoA dehydrogenase